MKKFSVVLLCSVGLLALIPIARADEDADLMALKKITDSVKSDLHGKIKGGVVRRLKQAHLKDYVELLPAQREKVEEIQRKLERATMETGVVGALAVTMKDIVEPLLGDVSKLIKVTDKAYDAVVAHKAAGEGVE